MKVKCIDNKYYKNKLIIGEIYECTICMSTDEYYDDCEHGICPKELFITIPEIRNEKIERLLKWK